MLRLCSESLRLYPGKPHRHATLCHCQKTSKALVEQALAGLRGRVLFRGFLVPIEEPGELL